MHCYTLDGEQRIAIVRNPFSLAWAISMETRSRNCSIRSTETCAGKCGPSDMVASLLRWPLLPSSVLRNWQPGTAQGFPYSPHPRFSFSSPNQLFFEKVPPNPIWLRIINDHDRLGNSNEILLNLFRRHVVRQTRSVWHRRLHCNGCQFCSEDKHVSQEIPTRIRAQPC